jgi:hypothetical protein
MRLGGLPTRVTPEERPAPLSGVASTQNSPEKPAPHWRQIAGPALTPGQFHCATVGAAAVINENDAFNQAHWRAAESGEWGYRRPGAGPQEPPKPPKPQASTDDPRYRIPDDLSIPEFLRRR